MDTSRFPAVLIGGPPHSGKSVFTYALKRTLQAEFPDLAFYVLRAAPDGEGDWFHEADQALVRRLRYKRPFHRAFAERIARAIAGRHLPLLVDAGGQITEEQEIIARHCTHAILLSADLDRLRRWEEFARMMGLTVVALLRSRLEGEGNVKIAQGTDTPVRGTITRLERHVFHASLSDQPALHAVARRLHDLFTYDHSTLRALHQATLPPDVRPNMVDVHTWPSGHLWEPSMLPEFISQLPEGPVALYGSAPTWVYGAAAAVTAIRSAPMFQFDPVLGWVNPPEVSVEAEPICHVHCVRRPGKTLLDVRLSEAYVELETLHGSGAPAPDEHVGLVLGGKLPLWLYTALVRFYTPRVPWLALYSPQGGGGIIISSSDGSHPVGAVHPVERWPHRSR